MTMERQFAVSDRWTGMMAAIAVAVVMLPATATDTVPAPAEGRSDLSRQPSWTFPTKDDLRGRMLAWIDGQKGADPAAVATARAMWAADAPPPADVLDATIDTFAVLDPRCESIRGMARHPQQISSGDVAWLLSAAASEDDGPAAMQRDAVRLWVGRHCVRHDRFDEGLEMLAGLSVEKAIDPAALLFHRAACRFWLLDADAAIEEIDRLLERADGIPVRYERTARLLRADIESLEEDSLDHIARCMRDVTRRLDLGRAGAKTRSVQDGVIASLDKLISKIEDQQNKNQGSGGGGGGPGGSGNSTPMDDSRIAGGKGRGEVQNREIGDADGWGNLPPHQREEALQQIGREFPAHYREAIEQYFKRLASGGENR
ncbi:MAG: hypothetical protein ACKOYJ_12025 [Planctomycetia bacterium]